MQIRVGYELIRFLQHRNDLLLAELGRHPSFTGPEPG
jgi:hypothetical protein